MRYRFALIAWRIRCIFGNPDWVEDPNTDRVRRRFDALCADDEYGTTTAGPSTFTSGTTVELNWPEGGAS